MHTKTLNRLQQQLLEFDFDIRYKEGTTHAAANALSLNTVASPNDESGTMREAQAKDHLCGAIREFLQIGCLPSASKREEVKTARQAQTCFLSEGLYWRGLFCLVLCLFRYVCMHVCSSYTFVSYKLVSRILDLVLEGYNILRTLGYIALHFLGVIVPQ